MTIAAVGGVLSARSPSARTEADTSGTSTSSAANGSSSSSSSRSSTSTGAPAMLDRDAFLKLLVAQLKYQDPSKPADSSEMISQSAQLSVVDKLDEISKSITDASATNRLNLGGSIIGKQVTFAGTDGVPTSQVVTAVSFVGTSMVLRAGTWDVPIDAVTAISQAPATTTTTTPTGTTGSGTTGTSGT